MPIADAVFDTKYCCKTHGIDNISSSLLFPCLQPKWDRNLHYWFDWWLVAWRQGVKLGHNCLPVCRVLLPSTQISSLFFLKTIYEWTRDNKTVVHFWYISYMNGNHWMSGYSEYVSLIHESSIFSWICAWALWMINFEFHWWNECHCVILLPYSNIKILTFRRLQLLTTIFGSQCVKLKHIDILLKFILSLHG